MDENVTMSKQEIALLINTLKRLDVRGYDSMNMLVGMVAFLSDVSGRSTAICNEKPKE